MDGQDVLDRLEKIRADKERSARMAEGPSAPLMRERYTRDVEALRIAMNYLDSMRAMNHLDSMRFRERGTASL